MFSIHEYPGQLPGSNGSMHLEAITLSASDAIISANSEGNIISWNPAAEKIFGYAAAEVKGKPLTIIIPERFKKMHEDGMKRVTEGGEKHVIGHVVELFGVRKNGDEFPLELSLSSWETSEGMFFGGIIRDISERKMHEQILKNNESRFRSITESAHDAIISANSEGNIISWNHAAEKIFGYTIDEVIQKPITIIIPERFHQMHNEGMKRVASGGERHVIGHVVELFGVRKNGEEFPLELSLSSWETSEGMFFGGIIRDISERKKHEQILKNNESRFRSITESAHDVIITADDHGKIITWNKAACNVFGYASTEVIGKSLSIIVPDEYKAMHEAGIQRVASGGPKHVIGKTAELSGLHKLGHTFPIELSLSMWETDGKCYFTGIIRDITDRKKADILLQMNKEKLAKKNKKLTSLNAEVKQKNEQLQALSNKLAKYLSRQVYTSIFQGKRDVKIESYRKKLTVFFSDIQGFTELTDRVESEVLTSVLNKYLNAMSQIALDCGGTIDKFIGDAIMIFFGDPETLGEKQDAIACVKMALKMRDKLVELRREWEILGIATPLHVRMGINTGFCTVGNFGSDERLDYTIVGGPVNLASRLEGAAEVNQILISQDTYGLIKEEVLCEKKELIKVKGQAYPVQTYQVLDLVSELKSEKEILEAALKGFNISIEFNKLNYTDKLYAKELLEKAILKLT